MKVIANTTNLSNFAAAGRLDVLRHLLGELHISTDVYAEIQDGLAEGFLFYAGLDAHIHPFAADGWLRLTSPEGDDELGLLNRFPASLHRGEASCLAIAAHRGWALLTDDARARQAAQELNVTFSGTLGLLVQAVKASVFLLDEADALLNQMIRAGYRSPFTSLAELL
jgi:predicted nucleic acid-binding protein